MNWIEALLRIREAQENNRLVLFVGAGVSRNSNVPTWGELIRDMAVSIGYEHCAICHRREECEKDQKRECKYEFTQDEYLKIPEYFYQKDTTQNKDTYYNFIKSKLDVNSKPNPIDYEIFRVFPHHIITTNYDPLLEKTKSVNANMYSVIAKDGEILSKANPRYLVKMHGDFADMKSIVLKESDYLNYEQEHPLISTFIRSLLIDHTFVFLGYSLNDSNLNLIIGWINYFKEKHNVQERPDSFLLTTSNVSEFERGRLENKSIYTVNLQEMPLEIIKSPSGIGSMEGKNLYSFMRLIRDEKLLKDSIPYMQYLNERLSLLASYEYVSLEDFLQTCPIGKVEAYSDELIFYDGHEYESFANALAQKDEVIESTIRRSMISGIALRGDNTKSYEIIRDGSGEIERLYLDNSYVDLKRRLSKESISTQIYFAVYFGENIDEINSMIEYEEQEVSPLDYISVLLHKIRERLSKMSLFNRQEQLMKEINQIFDLMPHKYRAATGFLYKFIHSEDETKQKMRSILDKQREHYAYRINGFRSGHAFQHLYSLQSFVYDYYFFFKRNMLPIDHFSDPKSFFKYYLQAILCTYSPISDSDDNNWGFGTHRERYPLNEIDLDIIVKYTNEKDLKKWIHETKAKQLLFNNNIKVSQKFKNLCDSLEYLKSSFIAEYIVVFAMILAAADDIHLCKESFSTLIGLFIRMSKEKPELCINLFSAVYELSLSVDFNEDTDLANQLAQSLCDREVFIKLNERHEYQIQKLLKRIGDFCSMETKNYLASEVGAIDNEKERAERIVSWRGILPMDQYHDYIQEHEDLLRIDQLFNLIIDKHVKYDDRIDKLFLDKIEKEVESRTANPGMRTFPDWLEMTINDYIILYLLGFDIEISKLDKYREYSAYIGFLVSPDTFDYSLVDLGDYMWQNIIRSVQYQKWFIEHKSDLFTEKLKRDLLNDVTTRDQEKIVYGILLDKDELWQY